MLQKLFFSFPSLPFHSKQEHNNNCDALDGHSIHTNGRCIDELDTTFFFGRNKFSLIPSFFFIEAYIIGHHRPVYLWQGDLQLSSSASRVKFMCMYFFFVSPTFTWN